MRKITSSLSIGNATDGCEHGPEFDRVVSLASASDATTHPHLINDGEHDYDEFSSAVDAICDGLNQDETVLVHCQAGLSRSVSAAIAALVVAEYWEYTDAYDACRSGFIHPDADLVDSAKQYIDTNQP